MVFVFVLLSCKNVQFVGGNDGDNEEEEDGDDDGVFILNEDSKVNHVNRGRSIDMS